MKTRFILRGMLVLTIMMLGWWPATAWEAARRGEVYEFPRDHLAHRNFKTEWWYFTGNLRAATGEHFGYQVTFFRQGVNREPGKSNFAVGDLAFAHAAISDVDRKKHYFSQVVSRMNFGEAGFGGPERVAWIDSWEAKLTEAGGWQFRAEPDGQKIELTAVPEKPLVFHGDRGFSEKAAGGGHASHYYSQTRLRMSGKLTIAGKVYEVSGLGWFDHEWATNQLAPNQVGWDWLSLHLADGRELMLYQMRLEDGGVDGASSGTLIEKNGETRHLLRKDFQLTPLGRRWKSPETGANYPLDWKVEVPSAGLAFVARARLENQEMNLPPVAYWEGAMELQGVEGEGYMELTGYGEALKALRGQ